MRTVHRSEHDLFRAGPHRRVHVVVEVLPVAGTHVELPLGELGCVDVLVAVLAFELNDEALDLRSHGGSGREPQRQPRPAELVVREDAELAADAAMVRVFHGVVPLVRGQHPERKHRSAPGSRPGAVSRVLLHARAGQTRRRREHVMYQHDIMVDGSMLGRPIISAASRSGDVGGDDAGVGRHVVGLDVTEPVGEHDQHLAVDRRHR